MNVHSNAGAIKIRFEAVSISKGAWHPNRDPVRPSVSLSHSRTYSSKQVKSRKWVERTWQRDTLRKKKRGGIEEQQTKTGASARKNTRDK